MRVKPFAAINNCDARFVPLEKYVRAEIWMATEFKDRMPML